MIIKNYVKTMIYKFCLKNRQFGEKQEKPLIQSTDRISLHRLIHSFGENFEKEREK